MELIDRHTKYIMEGCKERARDAGLRFEDESLEYIVTNRDLLELSPKLMIPTLYDYWVHDVEVLKERGKYELYPGNPYETVINTRPAISFYNDNNPDWLNVMIFYHVLGHIDFFQNNLFFRHTWDYDFNGQALSDKRLIARLRSEKGRWVDYVIEFARGIDNQVGYHDELARMDRPLPHGRSLQLDYYFDVFLQTDHSVSTHEYIQEIESYNDFIRKYGQLGEESFFAAVSRKYPEFDSAFEKYKHRENKERMDLMQFVLEHSAFLNRAENRWMKSIIQVVRNTSLFFQPQIRTRIMNEGWASYWHETLFLQDDRIAGHEVDYARVNAGVTALSRVGVNPYALGMRLFYYIEEMADKGKLSMAFKMMADEGNRGRFDTKAGGGREKIFNVRENFCDFMFINTFVDQDFVNRHRLFVVGTRLNQDKTAWEYYVRSRKAEAYRNMLADSLYHPPHIEIDTKRTARNGTLQLVHRFEGKPLVRDFIANTMMGIEFLWGGPVKLDTREIVSSPHGDLRPSDRDPSGLISTVSEDDIVWQDVCYTMTNRKLSKETL